MALTPALLTVTDTLVLFAAYLGNVIASIDASNVFATFSTATSSKKK